MKVMVEDTETFIDVCTQTTHTVLGVSSSQTGRGGSLVELSASL